MQRQNRYISVNGVIMVFGVMCGQKCSGAAARPASELTRIIIGSNGIASVKSSSQSDQSQSYKSSADQSQSSVKSSPQTDQSHGTTTDRLSAVKQKMDSLRGCDWLQEISITVRKFRRCSLNNDRSANYSLLTDFIYRFSLTAFLTASNGRV